MTTTRDTKAQRTGRFFESLRALGIGYDHADQLRRIEMTLQRWSERECGDGNDYGSWAIERDEKTEKPFLVHHHYMHGRGKDYVSRTPIADREAGALRRLAEIMKSYPDLVAYHQTDPRGCALYIVRKSDIPEGESLSAYYTRGVAVCI